MQVFFFAQLTQELHQFGFETGLFAVSGDGLLVGGFSQQSV